MMKSVLQYPPFAKVVVKFDVYIYSVVFFLILSHINIVVISLHLKWLQLNPIFKINLIQKLTVEYLKVQLYIYVLTF